MAYEKLNWQDGKQPALNAENLNHMEDGIVGADTMANQALEAAQAAGMKVTEVFKSTTAVGDKTVNIGNADATTKFYIIVVNVGQYGRSSYLFMPGQLGAIGELRATFFTIPPDGGGNTYQNTYIGWVQFLFRGETVTVQSIVDISNHKIYTGNFGIYAIYAIS